MSDVIDTLDLRVHNDSPRPLAVGCAEHLDRASPTEVTSPWLATSTDSRRAGIWPAMWERAPYC